MSDLLLKQVADLLERALLPGEKLDQIYNTTATRELLQRIKEVVAIPDQLNLPITVRDLVAALRYNTDYQGWTKESILKQIEWIHRPLTGAEVGNLMHYAKRELEQARKCTVAALNERNREYGRLSGKYQELKKELRNANKLKRELMEKLIEINKIALHGQNMSADIQKIVGISKVKS